jgi:hypothetical protein
VYLVWVIRTAWALAMLGGKVFVPTNGRAIVDDPAMTGIHVTK